MIRIKTVDAQNILDVCRLTTHQDCIGAAAAGHPCCNAIAIAETKYDPEMHPNAIYNNNVLRRKRYGEDIGRQLAERAAFAASAVRFYLGRLGVPQ